MGRLWPELGSCGSWMWAVGGRARRGGGRMTSSMLEVEALVGGAVFRLGSSEEGEFRRLGAPGHPQEECSVRRVVDSGEV